MIAGKKAEMNQILRISNFDSPRPALQSALQSIDCATLFELFDKAVNLGFPLAERSSHLIKRWRDAVPLDVFLDDVEKLRLFMSEANQEQRYDFYRAAFEPLAKFCKRKTPPV